MGNTLRLVDTSEVNSTGKASHCSFDKSRRWVTDSNVAGTTSSLICDAPGRMSLGQTLDCLAGMRSGRVLQQRGIFDSAGNVLLR